MQRDSLVAVQDKLVTLDDIVAADAKVRLELADTDTASAC